VAVRPKTGRPISGHRTPGSFEAEDTRRDRKARVKAKQRAVAGHPSDGVTMTISQSVLDGRVSYFM
jgi:hypothetical protein